MFFKIAYFLAVFCFLQTQLYTKTDANKFFSSSLEEGKKCQQNAKTWNHKSIKLFF